MAGLYVFYVLHPSRTALYRFRDFDIPLRPLGFSSPSTVAIGAWVANIRPPYLHLYHNLQEDSRWDPA